MGRAAAERPLLLVIDDVHCADESTLALLSHIPRSLAGVRAALLSTYRESESAPLVDLLAGLARDVPLATRPRPPRRARAGRASVGARPPWPGSDGAAELLRTFLDLPD